MKKKIQLQDIPKNSPLRITMNDGSIDLATFFHCDGLYSYCETSDKKSFHLSRMTPMKLVNGRYEIDN
jgi:hypothetical protein